MARSVELLCSSEETGCGVSTSLGVACLPPWLMLAKTNPVTYKIQRHVRAEPEVMHVDKLLLYQADFQEELHSWLHDEESDG